MEIDQSTSTLSNGYGWQRRLFFQRFGVEAEVFLAAGFFLGVLFHPSFPGFAGGCVASGEGEGGDVGVGDRNFLVGVLWVEADLRVCERFSGAAVEEVAFDFGSVFAGDGDVSAVVEGFF